MKIVKELVSEKITKYENKLKDTVVELIKLKTINKDLNPQIQVIQKMTKLPELKEKALNYKMALDDMTEIWDSINNE